MSPGHEGRRRWHRVPAGFDIVCRIGDQTAPARAVDISGGGIFVNLETLPNVGDEVYMTFVLPEEVHVSAVKVIGEVKRVVPKGTQQEPGFGSLFVAVQAEARMAILRFIEKVSIRTLQETAIMPPGGGGVEIKVDEV